MSGVHDGGPSAPTRRGRPFKFLDSALAIAVVVGILHYAGWTFRLAYLKRFSIDPSGLDASSVSIAVDGVGAIGTTLLAWLAACAFLLIAGACTWAFVSFMERGRGRNGPLADRTTLIIAQAAGIAFGMLFLLWGDRSRGEWQPNSGWRT